MAGDYIPAADTEFSAWLESFLPYANANLVTPHPRGHAAAPSGIKFPISVSVSKDRRDSYGRKGA